MQWGESRGGVRERARWPTVTGPGREVRSGGGGVCGGEWQRVAGSGERGELCARAPAD